MVVPRFASVFFSVIKGRVHGACGLTDQGEYQSRSLKFLCQ